MIICGRRVAATREGVHTTAVPAPPVLFVAQLTVPADGDEPPSQFRIFRAGKNETTNGDFVFDDVAAEQVMSAHRAHGVDIMIDLEHLSTDPENGNFDPDARGWCELEVRAGELWAVNVRWTDDGAKRLREKRQRYVSPTFSYDTESRRPAALLNIALTALPATHHAVALMAARAQQQYAPDQARAEHRGNMADVDPKTLAAVMKAVKLDPKVVDKLAVLVGLEAGASIEDVSSGLERIKAKLAQIGALLADDAGAGDAPAEPPPGGAGDGSLDGAAASSSLSALGKLVGRTTHDEIVAEVSRQLGELRAQRDAAELARREAEVAERRSLVATLVKAGAETPATAWSDQAGTVPVARLESEPIAELRDRVAKIATARGIMAPVAPPAAGPGGSEHGLTREQLALCAAQKIEPAQFAQMRERMGLN